ncbi:MAG TPA: ATP-binding protein [Acidobacteriaceae bacterium]|nr:ATP-binding protein [Acidobacteriaceae bacterium]
MINEKITTRDPVPAAAVEAPPVKKGKTRRQSVTSPGTLLGFAAAAALLFVAWMAPHWQHSAAFVPAHTYSLQAQNSSEWTPLGGSWSFANDAVQSNSYERGAKLLAGSKYWSNYTLTTDILFWGPAADMGVVIRTNDESRGVDAYNGYFVGFRSLDGTLVIGRANYSWLEVMPVVVPGGVGPHTWYRLRVTAYGCNIGTSVTNLSTQQTAYLAFQEHFCIKSGRFGLRTLNANAQWRNVRVEPATWQDYHNLEKHAGFVQHPRIVNGPPWWTPWHVGMLFSVALTGAMLIQLVWFRLRTWKTNTINRERERLAHEIHDTMAQGFAGIGYQIQGIRTGIVRSETLDPRTIVEQLNVAYQSVRSCHEEASRTIALLSEASPSIKNDLLGELNQIARRTAPTSIAILAEIDGEPRSLSLRVADALLHIGRESIVNALSHGNPTAVKIVLSYRDGNVELIVADNGSGFDYAARKEGFGILGMQKRARGVGSVLEMRSAPEQGTEVRVKVRLRSVLLRDRFVAVIERIVKGNGSA